ncbi:MAG: ABC transporter permease [Acidobacteria bacterium]|nr:MAG: ABC transporter permease [Acidobacteriota bacterium]
MKKILAQANKEWMQLRRDRLLLALGVLMPLVLLFLYGTSQSLQLRNVPVAAYDYDNSVLSRAYIETYGAAITFRLVPHDPQKSPESTLLYGDARAVLIIPANFDRDVRRGSHPRVQLLIDGTDANTGTVLKNMARSLNASFLKKNNLTQPSPVLVRLEPRLWFNPGLSNAIYFGTGALAMVLALFPALLGALSVAREYELGNIIQAYASSLSGFQWIVGKSIPYIILGFVELVICFALGMLIFDYHIPTDPSVLLVATFFYLVAGIFYGMLFGNATGTQSAAIQGVQMGAFLLALLLSGYLFPVRNIPDSFRWISYTLPATHYIVVVRNCLLRDAEWNIMLRPITALAVLSAIFFALNMLQVRKMQFKG